MPLLLKLPICPDCKVSMVLTKARLICASCGNAKSLGSADLDKLHTEWPLCDDEFMSLERHSKCATSTCTRTSKEFFPHGRIPLDCLPGTYDTRVFIGGNYDNMPDLRNVKAAIHKLKGTFVPILPYDDFQIPQDRIYEWDLRLLHNCRYAIFDVTEPAGELFEIARASEFGVTTLFVYKVRGATPAPPRARTMLLQSGTHEHRGYMDLSHLERIVDEFLRQKSPAQWKRAVDLMGYHFAECHVGHKFDLRGEGEHSMSFRGLKIGIPDLQQSEITHEFSTTSGAIVADSFHLEPSNGISWHRNNAKSGSRAEAGVVRFDPPLDCNRAPVDYSFSLRTENAYMLTKSQLSKLPIKDVDNVFLAAGLEFASRVISCPIEKFVLSVEFPPGYRVNPKAATYFGTERRNDGLRMPPDDFSFDGKTAVLYVRRPRLYYQYAIYWELPDELVWS